MAKIYLSGQFEDGLLLCQVRDALRAQGHVVTARWLDSAGNAPATLRAASGDSSVDLAAIARQDLEDIAAADVIAVFNPVEAANRGRGGRHVELGVALALHKAVVVVGVRSNVFHWLSEVRVVENWSAFEALLITDAPRSRDRAEDHAADSASRSSANSAGNPRMTESGVALKAEPPRTQRHAAGTERAASLKTE